VGEAVQVVGVLYTVHPDSAAEDEALIEARAANPDAGGREPTRLTVAFPSGELRSRSGSLSPGSTPEGSWWGELLRLGAQHQERVGQPLEVEFTVGARGVVVHRVQPMERFSFAHVEGEWTTANFREGGASSTECSAFMSSLYHEVFSRSIAEYFTALRVIPPGHPARWIRTFFSRPYWNFGEVKRAVARLPGFVERNFDHDLGIPATYEGDGQTTPMTLGGAIRAVPVLLALQRSYGRILRQVREYVRDFPLRKEPFDLEPAALSVLPHEAFVERCRRFFHELYLPTERLYFTSVYNLSNAKLELSHSLARASLAAGGSLSYSRLVGALGDVSHLRPMRELRVLVRQAHEVGRGVPEPELRAFAQRWAHRGARELDVRIPRWGEDFEQVRGIAAQALASFEPGLDSAAQEEHQRAEFHAERERARAALPLPHRLLFNQRLERVRACVWWREEMRDHSSRVYLLVRRWMLEAGRRLVAEGRLEQPEDVWSLRLDSVFDALEGRHSREETLRLAREGTWCSRSFQHFDAPGEIGTAYPRSGERVRPAGSTYQGTGSSPGEARGPARVARTLAEAMALKPGEVLVACFSDPGWTPLFSRARAVVTERGGLLSHAAVIAREYGIPAVLGVRGATEHIRTGDMVSVDGTRGTLQVHSGTPADGAQSCC
jgi:phosphohistidine swiveling domain-containing protein